MKNWCLLVVSLIALQAGAQNLVANPSFEEKSYCPVSYNQQRLTVLTSWAQASDGTPDYFNACSKAVGVPKNVFGEEPASHGEGYAGLATYSPGKRNYREYLQSKLSRPLKSGEMVCIEAKVSSADQCLYVTDGFGILLSKEKVAHERNQVINIPPSLSNPRLYMLDETSGWVRISDVYEAKGGEEYLTIGNFSFDRDLTVLKRTKEQGASEGSGWAYLYVDEIVVKPVKNKSECSCDNDILASLVHDPPLELQEYETVQLDAVLFDFDQDILSDTAQQQLDDIYALLRKNRSMNMEISGHTDSIGNQTYNDTLSFRRATRVINYLVNKGIERSRFEIKYFGAEKPVAPNETDQGRAMNRRVEFQIIRMKYELIKQDQK
ncbi:MAG: hypothetical protein RL220_1045 [Bacteroidota bacterium]